MKIVSVGPLRVGSLPWRAAPDRPMLSVVAKATYALQPGTSDLTEEQEDVVERDNHWDDDPGRSVFAPSDLVPFKRRVDVVLVGYAFAPQGKPVRSLPARLSVGGIDKTVEVVCPRIFTRDGAVRDGARWTRMPLRYERAAGGPGTWNPVGVSPDAAPDPYGQRPLPNMQPPGLHVASRADFIPPLGFGPIPATWPSRRERLRRRAEPSREASFADMLVEDDFDAAYFQAAPADQQIDELPGDAHILLENLHPEHPRLSTGLSGVRPRAFVEVPDAPAAELSLSADMLWIDTERGLCTVTWRGQLPLSRRDQPGRVVVAAEAAGQRLDWAAVRALPEIKGKAPSVTSTSSAIADPASTADIPRDHTMPGKPGVTRNPLPFARAEHVDRPSAPPQRGATALPPRSGPRSTVQMVVPDNIASIPPWMAAREASGAPPPMGVPGSAPPAEQAWSPAPTFGAPPLAEPPPATLMYGGASPEPAPAAPTAPSAPSVPPPAYSYAPDRRPAAYTLLSPSSDAAPALTLGQQSMGQQSMGQPSMGQPSVSAPPTPAPPEMLVAGTARAALLAAPAGAAAASTAAAGPAARVEVTPDAGAPRPTAGSMLELIWFDPELARRVRKEPVWAPLLKPPPRKPTPQKGAPPTPPEPPEAAAESARADVATVLRRGEPLTVEAIEAALEQALGESDSLTPPLVLVTGELELSLDGAAMLEATIAAATPLAAADKRLKEILDLCAELVKGGPLPPDVVDGQIHRVREAWSKANRLLPPSYLETQPEGALLEQRKYQKRELLDAAWIRSLIHVGGPSAPPIPAYLPVALEKRLPLFKRFPAHLLAEAVPQQDHHESHHLALRVTALARVISARGRAR